MTNKEQIQRDMAVAFDFVEQIIDEPGITDKIPNESAITFINEEKSKIVKHKERTQKKHTLKLKGVLKCSNEKLMFFA